MDFQGKPRMRHVLVQGCAALMLLTAQQAEADDDADLLQALTCQLSDDAARNARVSALLEAKARKSGDGSLSLEGRVQSGDVCVENATVSGAFGVMMATARLCDAQVQPMEAFLARASGQLEAPALPAGAGARAGAGAGVIRTYKAPRFSFVIFRGQPDFRAGPDPSSNAVSYICTAQGSGPQ